MKEDMRSSESLSTTDSVHRYRKSRWRVQKIMLIAQIIVILAALSVAPGAAQKIDALSASYSYVVPDRIIKGHADSDYYYLASHSATDPGTVYVYDKATLELRKIISLPFPRYMTSRGDLFICTYNEPGGPGGPTEVWSGIAIYNKTDDFSLLKLINLNKHLYTEYCTRQPMIDDENIYIPVAESANNPSIAIYSARFPFDRLGSIEPPHGDANNGADDDKYVAVTTAFYGFHQYVYDKVTRGLVADITGPNHGEGIEFYNHEYLFICYLDCYRKYNYSDLLGPYKEVTIPEMKIIYDVQSVEGCNHLLFYGYAADGREVLQLRNPKTDELVVNLEPTFEGWIQFLSCNSPPSTREVEVDIKPGSCPNPINTKSKGVIPLAIVGTKEFDVTTIDPKTILLSRDGIIDNVSPTRWNYDDVASPSKGELCDCHELSGDGYMDMILHFDTQALIAKLKLKDLIGGTIPVKITGKLKEANGGTPIEGQDCIKILK